MHSRINFITLVTTLGVLALPTVASAQGAQGSAAKVISVDGVARAGDRELQPGDSLSAGEVVKTAAQSAVKLLMEDRTVLDVGADSQLKIRSFDKGRQASDRKVELELTAGRVRASVNSKVSAAGHFQIRTRTAVMGVRGTEFIVGGDTGKVTVLHGVVAVDPSSGNGKTTGIKVTAGQQTSIQGTGAFKVAQLSPKDLQAVANLARVQNNVFSHTIVVGGGSSSRSGAGRGTFAALAAAGGAGSGASRKLASAGGVDSDNSVSTPGTDLTLNPIQTAMTPGLPVTVHVTFRR